MSFAAKIGLGLLLVLVTLLGIGVLGLVYLDHITAAKVDPAHAARIAQLQHNLRTKGYFTPREIGYPNAMFFCVCGQYSTCEPQSRELSSKIAYSQPPHDFASGVTRRRSLLMYFLLNKVVSIEVPFESPYFTVDHEAYCNTNLNMNILRQGAQ